TPTMTIPPTPCVTFAAVWTPAQLDGENTPRGIAVYPGGTVGGRLYVTQYAGYQEGTSLGHDVVMLALDGTYLGTFGLAAKNDGAIGKLLRPLMPLVDAAAQEVYVTDSAPDGRVDVFDLDGQFKRQIGKGQMNYPYSSVLDGKGYL